MSSDPKLIGVCMSQAHTWLKTDLLCHLSEAARKAGFGILVFNSSLDYYWSIRGDNVTGCVYRLIRFDRLAALVILHDNLYDEGLLQELVASARKQQIPVINLGGVLEGCLSIVDDYADAYEEVLRHLVRDHGVTDTFYIAGLKEESNSLSRLRCWQKVMTEAGLPCGEDRIAWGNYLDVLAAEITESQILTRPVRPQAVCCANDSMAAAVCDTLKKHGIRVPEDMIVTGFDGTPTASLAEPRLTTCDSNPADLADQVVALIRGFDPARPSGVYRHPYKPVIARSCGCCGAPDLRFSAFLTFRQAERLFTHENTMYYTVEQLLEKTDLHAFLAQLSGLLLPGSALYLNRSLLEANPDLESIPDHPEDELIMVPWVQPGEQPALRKVYRKDMPLPRDTFTGVTLLNIVHSNARVCGYYAAYTENLGEDFQLIKRLSDVLNMISSIQVGRLRQSQLLARLENNLYVDAVSELSNLKGLTRWYETYASDPASRRRMLLLSVYAVPRYSWIYETYGMTETEDIARLISRTLRAVYPSALHLARISEDQFVVIEAPEDGASADSLAAGSSRAFFRHLEESSSASVRPYLLDVSFGSTHVRPVWERIPLENLIRLALGEMYLNRLGDSALPDHKPSGNSDNLYSAFCLLMEKNLFRYYFQPIVDARTGIIFAYEALMRTDPLVNLSPLEILAIAREHGRLYEVERATLFGIMERFVRNYSDFKGCKVFINTIPGYFLNDDDCLILMKKYETFLDCFVFELTEDNPTSDEELARLKKFCKSGSYTRIAIDDYGTGHSNIVNLLRYTPNFIKIDRGLIAGIASDNNRQLFVRNTIDFAHQNGIRALAEGVETEEELRAVIRCGVDLIQGYYTGRPAESPPPAIPESIRSEIMEERLQLADFDRAIHAYTPKSGETMNLLDLALRKYSCIRLKAGAYTIRGEKDHNVEMMIEAEERASIRLTLDQVNMKCSTGPVIRLSRETSLELNLVGQNTLNKDGILVPPSASLEVCGDGSLTIHNNRNYSVGIGANYNDPYGSILFRSEGIITLDSSGDKVVCIGGGDGQGIRIESGTFRLSASGINVLGIGSAGGETEIDIQNAEVSVQGEGNDVLLIGCTSGTAHIRLNADLSLSAACERATCVGTLNGTADIRFSGGSVQAHAKCDVGAIIGTFDGEAQTLFRDTKVRIHGEGNHIAGFGSLSGACDTRIESGEISGNLLASERLLLGNEHSRFIVTGGNIQLFHEEETGPVSPGGKPLTFVNPEGDHFEQTFTEGRKSWTYRADRSEEGFLGVWIPFS